MSKSVLEKISDEVLARLQRIATGNGFDFNASSVVQVSRNTNEWDAKPLRIVMVQKEEEYNTEASCPGNPPASAYDVDFEIWGYSHQLDVKDEIGIDEPAVTDNQILAAIRKALTHGNPYDWHTFDGNSFNAVIAGGEPFAAPGHDGGMVRLTVQYRTNEVDPMERR